MAEERNLQDIAETVAESVLFMEEDSPMISFSISKQAQFSDDDDEEGNCFSIIQRQSPPPLNSEQRNAKRPEWQRLCIQQGVCIHYVYGNCVYEDQCFYKHISSFTKSQLLFKTEMCRYGVNCVNRHICAFAHLIEEKRTPEQNAHEYFLQNPVRKTSPRSIISPPLSSLNSLSSLSSLDSPSISPTLSPIPSPLSHLHQHIHYQHNHPHQQQQHSHQQQQQQQQQQYQYQHQQQFQQQQQQQQQQLQQQQQYQHQQYLHASRMPPKNNLNSNNLNPTNINISNNFPGFFERPHRLQSQILENMMV